MKANVLIFKLLKRSCNLGIRASYLLMLKIGQGSAVQVRVCCLDIYLLSNQFCFISPLRKTVPYKLFIILRAVRLKITNQDAV